MTQHPFRRNNGLVFRSRKSKTPLDLDPKHINDELVRIFSQSGFLMGERVCAQGGKEGEVVGIGKDDDGWNISLRFDDDTIHNYRDVELWRVTDDAIQD